MKVMNLLRVLIADDHPLIREAFEVFLRRSQGVEFVCSAPNAMQALADCEVHAPNVVLLDWNMAGLTGSDAAAEIKRRFPHIIIVGMSIARSARAAMCDAGADYFFDKAEILKVLPAVLGEVRQKLCAKK